MLDIKFSHKKRLFETGLEYIFWIRHIAFIIDYLLLIIFIRLVSSIAGLFVTLTSNKYEQVNDNRIFEPGLFKFLCFSFLVYVIYASILESSNLQSTLGKWFFRLKVCNLANQPLTFISALGRNLLKSISLITLIGAWLINLTKKKQGLHDLMARTKVKLR